jgi:hypothetical protein
MIGGYARVATDGQSAAARVADLQDAGAAKVWRARERLDRQARSTRDLLNILAAITGRKAGSGGPRRLA